MARNAHPELTQERIIKAATELFTRQGYDKTSMQDIINATGGLSKGAVYHHYQSKEDLFDAVANRLMSTVSETTSKAHARSKQDTALKQLQSLFSPERARKRLEAADLMFREFNPKANPKMIGMEFTALVDERDDFVDLIKQGNQEGSMHVDHVEQTAEIFRLLANMWLLPFFRRGTQAELRTRAACFFSILQGLGIPLEDQGFSDLLASFGTDAKGGGKEKTEGEGSI
ncbi:TetR/AcrR family transcriptional regulator [Bifidobacterium asteroides]|uniref:TetR/AcrR family transcriptional regulator n=1 Tax=Bifidobacterium asteroides TaxID=1684 RepID=UPI001C69DB12|nr:TetR/AcrR family transcriptional regulator [Bifidobacterium asteroides]QYN60509.1 TetR/AcrR family transcriptional regulator [Bifidobacterium asteroides]